MTIGGIFDELARTYCAFTGESLQYVKSNVVIDRATPIPAATSDQAVLESSVFQELLRRHEWFAHPHGISRVRIQPDNTVIVYLDSHQSYIGFRDTHSHDYPAVLSVIETVLPWVDSSGEVYGVLGARIEDIQGSDLTLTRIGTDARLVLRAVPGSNWERSIADWHDSHNPVHGVPIWHEPALTRAERLLESRRPMGRRYVWIGSGLLRRVALFHTMIPAFSTTMWTTGVAWMMELDTRCDVPNDHHTFIACLTDPIWGMLMRLTEDQCRCPREPHPTTTTTVRWDSSTPDPSGPSSDSASDTYANIPEADDARHWRARAPTPDGSSGYFPTLREHSPSGTTLS